MMGCGGAVLPKGALPIRSSSDLVEHMGKSTVALMAIDDEGEIRPYCTGVWISEDVILTANHCAVGGAALTLRVDEDEVEVNPMGVSLHYIVRDEVTGVGVEPSSLHLGKVMAVDKDHDLALIKAEGKVIPTHDVAVVASEMPALGEHVYVVGQVKGYYWSYVELVLSAYRSEMLKLELKFHGPFVQLSGPIYFGNSGGGCFDRDGKLIGIASFIVSSPSTSFFIHAESINKFLLKNKL